MKKNILTGVLVVGLMAFSAGASAATVTVGGNIWMPYTGDAGSDHPGYCVEILKAVFEAAGYEVKYQSEPLARVSADVLAGRIDVMASADKGDCPGCYFPSRSIGDELNAFYVRKDDPWKYRGVASLKDVRLGVINGYSYDNGVLDEYIKNAGMPAVQSASGNEALQTNISKLMAGRLDTIAVNDDVMRNSLGQPALVNAGLVSAGNLGDAEELYPAFAPDNPLSGKYKQIWDEGIEKLRLSGKLKEILARYNLVDWAASR